MISRKGYYIIAITVSALFVTYLHYSTSEKIHALHDIYRELYYIPLLMGAMVFGLKGAVITYIFVSALYLPYFITSWTGIYLRETDRLLQLLFPGLAALIAGFLIDRERKHREQMERDRHLAAIGKVSAAIVHDLKNPLISILGFAKRIHAGKGNIDMASQAIIGSAQNMQRIVHDVLDFSKPVQLQLKEENIKDVISRTSDACRIKAEKKGAVLISDLPPEPINILIDAFLLERALTNLINNAIEATSTGQKVIISAASGKKHIVIKVKDYGSGMDKETLDNIFIPFYTKKRTGTGLGMPIAKKIIDAHNGRLIINSKPSEGPRSK